MLTTKMKAKREHLIGFLINELGGTEKVKDFSESLRFLDLCDLRDDKHLKRVTDEGGVLLQTLVSWYQLGFISKLIDIKKGINDE